MNQQSEHRTLTGKTAIITGASRGIGAAIALRLAQLGANVTIDYLSNDERAQHTKQHIENEADAQGRVITCKADVTDETQVNELAQTTANTFGGIDILVNVAGIIIKDSLDDTDLERWNRILAVNLTADFLTIKQAVKRMRKQHYGRIVNVSSIAAKHGGGYLGGVAYASTKAGVAALTRGAAREYAPDGINVNAVMPGLTYTPMTAGMPDWKREAIEDSTLVKHGGQPYDIARAIVFLADPESGYIDGETLDVDGGTSLD